MATLKKKSDILMTWKLALYCQKPEGDETEFLGTVEVPMQGCGCARPATIHGQRITGEMDAVIEMLQKAAGAVAALQELWEPGDA